LRETGDGDRKEDKGEAKEEDKGETKEGDEIESYK
jgi:hypothetical protein